VEARSLAAGGEALLPRLGVNPRDLSEAAAAATVRTAALINGPDAWPVLERFAQDPRHEVQRELIKAWRYFDPGEYADRVLADAPLLDGEIRVDDEVLLTQVPKLRHLGGLRVELEGMADLRPLAGLPHLTSASLGGRFDDLAPLLEHRELHTLLLGPIPHVDLEPLAELALERLYFYPRGDQSVDLSELRALPRLSGLGVNNLAPTADLAPLAGLSRLEQLALYDFPTGLDPAPLGRLEALRDLDLGRLEDGRPLGFEGGLRALADYAPHLTSLGFYQVRLDDLAELARFPALRTLSLRLCGALDLSRLDAVKSLTALQISTTAHAEYLDQIRGLSGVQVVEILSSRDDIQDIDLSALGDRRMTVRVYANRHRVVGAGKGIKVERI
jgi:hypothetical protein